MNRKTKDLCQEIEDDLQILSFQISQNELEYSPKEDRKLFKSSLNNAITHIKHYESKKKVQKRVQKLRSILKNRL